MPDEAVEKKVFSKNQPAERPSGEDKVDLEEARLVTPFQIIRRGEDSLDKDDRVTFADFSPQVLPSDAPVEVEVDAEIETVPKDESAPEPAPSQEVVPTSMQTTPSQDTSEEPAQEAATKEDGSASPSESSKQSSSTPPKTG